MTTATVLADLRQRVQAGYPLLSLRTHEEGRWRAELTDLGEDVGRTLVSWTLTAGFTRPDGSTDPPQSPLEALERIESAPADQLFLLHDFHRHLSDAAVSRKLRDLAPRLPDRRQTILLMSPEDEIPLELIKDVARIDLPLPGEDDLRQALHDACAAILNPPPLADRDVEKLVRGVLGLTLAEARRALTSVLQGREAVSDDMFRRLAAEKRHLIQGSNLLEFFDLDDGIDDVGGLDGLKEWIGQRAAAFSADAASRGATLPRGVLLAGVQGCGKSLTARAIARMLGFPLVRLDVGSLLDASLGGSEQNLRDVLSLMDTMAPAVLWMEEIDKAFAGFTDEGAVDPVMSRLVGRFLTWLQEHPTPVFVAATANNITRLPPEMLRRGRFDELFFVDLPNYQERVEIFRIHLQKRGWKPEKFDLTDLSQQTDGFSGAEIEQVVNSAVIESFAAGRMPVQQDLTEARERTVPLSVTMEDEIFQLREWARTRCRPATRDHRVMQIMEEEERRGEAPQQQPPQVPRWKQLAEHGQLAAAVIEYVRQFDNVPWPRLLKDLEPFTAVRGEYGLVVRADPRTAIWLRLSREISDILTEAIEGRRLYLHIVPAEDFAQGERPQLPVITALPAEPSKKPVWLPTRLRISPPAEGSGKLGRLARVKMG